MMNKHKMHSDDIYITTVGALKRLLEPFVDHCEISPISVYYMPTTINFKGEAKVIIEAVKDE